MEDTGGGAGGEKTIEDGEETIFEDWPLLSCWLVGWRYVCYAS